MPYCSRCGVEVEQRADSCPLCEAPIQKIEEHEAEPPRYPEVTETPRRQVRSLVWLLATATVMSAVFTVLGLDVVLNQGVSWSRYPLTGLGVLWLFITLVVIFARRPIMVIAGQAVATAGFLVVIDLFNGRLEWFFQLALPIVAVVIGASLVVWLVARRCDRAPAMIAAAVLFGSGAGSIALDLLISGHRGAAQMSWSFIVIGAVTPPMAFLIYFQRRLRRRVNLASILHT